MRPFCSTPPAVESCHHWTEARPTGPGVPVNTVCVAQSLPLRYTRFWMRASLVAMRSDASRLCGA